MATYLCVKANNAIKSYTAKASREAGKPYLCVKANNAVGYFPLTTETSTGTQLKIKANNTTYRIVETFTTTSRIIVNTNTMVNTTTYQQVTYSTEYLTTSQTYYPFDTDWPFFIRFSAVGKQTRGIWYRNNAGVANQTVVLQSAYSDSPSYTYYSRYVGISNSIDININNGNGKYLLLSMVPCNDSRQFNLTFDFRDLLSRPNSIIENNLSNKWSISIISQQARINNSTSYSIQITYQIKSSYEETTGESYLTSNQPVPTITNTTTTVYSTVETTSQ